MRISSLVLLVLLTLSCSSKYEWHFEQYMATGVVNQSHQDVHTVFCSDQPAVVSKVLAVSADRKAYSSRTLYKIFSDKTPDHPQLESPWTYDEYFSYASLSANDLITSKLCVNADAFQSTGAVSETFQDRNSEKYLVLDKVDACPSGFKDFDQTNNPC